MRLNADMPSAVVIDLPLGEGTHPAAGAHALDHDLLRRNRIIGFAQADEQAHPYMVLRSQLLRHAKMSGMRVFAVTSAQPGNGKTHVAVNLAAALSRLHPTILVDLDLRRPSVGQRIGLGAGKAGIDDYLSGAVSLAQCATPIEGYDLIVHGAREHRGNAEELLLGASLSDFVATMRAAENDPICIIDTPPALVHDDLMLIARAIDGVLMVVEEGRTPKRALRQAIGALSPTPVVGCVLNRSLSPSNGASYAYAYGQPDPQRSVS